MEDEAEDALPGSEIASTAEAMTQLSAAVDVAANGAARGLLLRAMRAAVAHMESEAAWRAEVLSRGFHKTVRGRA